MAGNRGNRAPASQSLIVHADRAAARFAVADYRGATGLPINPSNVVVQQRDRWEIDGDVKEASTFPVFQVTLRNPGIRQSGFVLSRRFWVGYIYFSRYYVEIFNGRMENLFVGDS